MSKPRCQCTPTCRFGAAPGEPYMLGHDPRPEKREQRREAASRAGKLGGRASEAAKLTSCDLRSTDGQLTQLEGALLRVANCGADAVAKAGAICKLISEARSVMKDAVLEVENAELRALIAGKHPHLAKQLRVVP